MMASRLLLLLVITAASALDLRNRHFGASLTVVPRRRNSDGTFQLEVRSLQTTSQCHVNPYDCLYGDCGPEVENNVSKVAWDSYGLVWCTMESRVKLKLPHNHPIALRYPTLFDSQQGTGFWIPNVRGATIAWAMMVHIDLGIRSDTRGSNNPPVSAMLPIVRVTRNCPRTFGLTVFDADGDQVRCRVATLRSDEECGVCGSSRGLSLDPDSCSLTYTYSLTTGNHPMEVVLEDFPTQNIKLHYSQGYFTIKHPLPAARDKRFAQQSSGFSTTTSAPTTTATSAPATATTSTTTTTSTSAPAITTTTSSPITTPTSSPAITTTLAPTTTTITSMPSTIPTMSPPASTSTTSTSTSTSTPSITTTTTTWPQISTSTTSTPTTTTSSPSISKSTMSPPTTTATSTPTTTTTTSVPTTTATSTPTTTSTTSAPTTTTSTPTTPTTTSAPTTTATSTPNTTMSPPTTTTTSAPTTTTSTPTGTITTSTPATATTAPRTTLSTDGATNTTAASYYLTSIGPLSKVPLQFTVLVDSYDAPSCRDGDYFPVFLAPTPVNGMTLLASAGHSLEIQVRSTAQFTSIHDLVVIGPPGISKQFLSSGFYLIKWKPTVEDLNGHFPICFISEARDRSNRVYQSEPRCVTTRVSHHEAVVTCNQTSMTVEVRKNDLIRRNEDKVRLQELDDSSCSLKKLSNATHLVAVTALNACGTRIEENEANITFRNQITSADPNEKITGKYDIDIAICCVYPKRTNVTLGFRHKNPYAFKERGFGSFTFQFEFFQSQRFRQQVEGSTYPVEVYLNQMIYMQIQATSSIPNTELFVESCRATPYDNPDSHVSYTIIEDGCVKDPTVQIYNSSRSVFRFGMEAFEFIGAHDEVYISCSVILCESGAPGTRCSKGCLPPGSHRGKREASAQTSRHSISQGPLHLKASDSEAPTIPRNQVLALNQVQALNRVPALNRVLALNQVLVLNLVLAVGCLVACVLVLYGSSRSRTRYQRLPTFELD